MNDRIDKALGDHIAAIQGIGPESRDKISRAGQLISNALDRGHKVLVMGNGGSAADAQHLAAELVGRFLHERKALPAVALTTDTSILTSVGNDYGYEAVFLRQVEALAQKGDVVIGISTSGNSPNVALALERARSIGCQTLALTGKAGGRIAEIADLTLEAATEETPRIQEAHILMIHILCDLVEQHFV